MLRNRKRAPTPLVLTAGLLLAGVLPAAASTDALDALAATAPPVALLGRTEAAAPGPAAALEGCSGGQTSQCFDSGGPARYVNVATFFDRKARSSAKHFFVKLFTPPQPGYYRILGFSFVGNRIQAVYPAAGVVPTLADSPILPNSEQLDRLQRLQVQGAAPSTATCVDLTWGAGVEIQSDQVAWLVLEFPEIADTLFVGIRAESDANDRPCDYMTRDAGDYWYRPDPRQSPFDWQMTVHYEATVTKPVFPWTFVKALYR